MAIVNIPRAHSSALAMIGGIIMAATRLVLPNFFPAQATNGWATLFGALSSGGGITAFTLIAGIISFLVQFGGVSIFAGGLLCYKQHLRTGKELMSIGTTVGFADLILSIPSVASSNYAPPYLIAWLGLFIAVFAGRHVHGPTSSYAGEFRKLYGLLKSRFVKEEKKSRSPERPKPRPARQSLSSTRQYSDANNKNSQSKRPREKNTASREARVKKNREK
ncbi:MAG TPA: hypothetical protein VFE98_07370 [Candidatus Bathyarchaeia archaeon]|nr:hypothetical protein [Candidatus Bathyarchaeia archaeon]